jgi:hypothetical protein
MRTPSATKRPSTAIMAETIHRFIEEQLSSPRNREPLRLLRHGYKVYSQCDEDGILAEIFRRIGIYGHSFVEFGVENGLECNTLWLLVQGWNGLWIEANSTCCEDIRSSHEPWIRQGALTLSEASVTVDNINGLIGHRYRGVVDLLSIDIDYNDYHVWKAIEIIDPRVVCIEYNAIWRPPVSITVPYDPARSWAGDNYYGASLAALTKLGRQKGYRLVGCCLAGVNAFFVKEELCADLFVQSGEAADHYEPARYFLAQPQGHRPAIGPVVHV